MNDTKIPKNIAAWIDAIAHEIAARCTIERPPPNQLLHEQITRHARQTLADWITGKWSHLKMPAK